jgi:hypothetical protein
MEKWITTQEASEFSGYNVQHIRRLTRGELINCRKWGQEWIIDRESLLSYIKNQGQDPRKVK